MKTGKTLVWDLPTRAFHWLLALSFAGAWLTADSERWRDVHVLLGYTVAGLIAFRLVWGVFGTRYARFASLPLDPRAVFDYLRSLATRTPRHYFGHNPAGSWAIVAMLALLTLSAATGWAAYAEIGPGWLEELHEGAANATAVLVLVHVAAVFASCVLLGVNVVGAWVPGYPPGAGDAAAGTRWLVALVLVGAVGAFWAGLI
ncbi:MAG: cytochrome b/b6 domain-containing protein, partial [Burkholderiaceae bacterium]